MSKGTVVWIAPDTIAGHCGSVIGTGAPSALLQSCFLMNGWRYYCDSSILSPGSSSYIQSVRPSRLVVVARQHIDTVLDVVHNFDRSIPVVYYPLSLYDPRFTAVYLSKQVTFVRNDEDLVPALARLMCCPLYYPLTSMRLSHIDTLLSPTLLQAPRVAPVIVTTPPVVASYMPSVMLPSSSTTMTTCVVGVHNHGYHHTSHISLAPATLTVGSIASLAAVPLHCCSISHCVCRKERCTPSSAPAAAPAPEASPLTPLSSACSSRASSPSLSSAASSPPQSPSLDPSSSTHESPPASVPSYSSTSSASSSRHNATTGMGKKNATCCRSCSHQCRCSPALGASAAHPPARVALSSPASPCACDVLVCCDAPRTAPATLLLGGGLHAHSAVTQDMPWYTKWKQERGEMCCLTRAVATSTHPACSGYCPCSSTFTLETTVATPTSSACLPVSSLSSLCTRKAIHPCCTRHNQPCASHHSCPASWYHPHVHHRCHTHTHEPSSSVLLSTVPSSEPRMLPSTATAGGPAPAVSADVSPPPSSSPSSASAAASALASGSTSGSASTSPSSTSSLSVCARTWPWELKESNWDMLEERVGSGIGPTLARSRSSATPSPDGDAPSHKIGKAYEGNYEGYIASDYESPLASVQTFSDCPTDPLEGLSNASTTFPFILDNREWPSVDHFLLHSQFEAAGKEDVAERIRGVSSVKVAHLLASKYMHLLEQRQGRAGDPQSQRMSLLPRVGYSAAPTEPPGGTRARWTCPAERLTMIRAIRAKIAHNPQLQLLLLSTGDKALVWRATSKDQFSATQANNQLAKILVELRNKIVAETKTAAI